MLVKKVCNRIIKTNFEWRMSNATGRKNKGWRFHFVLFCFSSPFTPSPHAELDWIWLLKAANSSSGSDLILRCPVAGCFDFLIMVRVQK